MQDLNDLYYFVKVVDHGGFAPAARALFLPKSKLSRRLALLEGRLGVQLIERSTRRFLVTDLGRSYYRHCKAMLIEAEAAQRSIEIRRSEPCGILRVSCPVALLHICVGEMLADFMTHNPRIELQLEATNRRVDVLGENVDVAVRVRYPPLHEEGLSIRLLGAREQCLVASPSFVQRYGPFTMLADVGVSPSLDIGPPQPEHVWRLEGPDGQPAEVHHRPRLITDDMIALRTAALAGVGMVLLPTVVVMAALRRGDLVAVLPAWAPRRHLIHAVYPPARAALPSVQALLHFLALRFEQLDET